MRFYATIFTAMMALLLAGGAAFQSAAINAIAAPTEQHVFTIAGSVIAEMQEVLHEHTIHIVDGFVHLDHGNLAPRGNYLGGPASLCTCEATVAQPTGTSATVPEVTLGTATILTTAEFTLTSTSALVVTPGVPGLSVTPSEVTLVEAPSTAGTTAITTGTTSSVTATATLTASKETITGATSGATAVPTNAPGSDGQKHVADIIGVIAAFVFAAVIVV